MYNIKFNSYIPEPNPAKSDRIVAAHYYPAWKKGAAGIHEGFDDLAGNVTNEQGCVVSGGAPIPFVPVYKGTVPTPDKLLTDMYMGLAANDTSKIAGMNTMYVPGYDTPAGFVSLFVEAFIPGSN